MTVNMPDKLSLARLDTPIEQLERLPKLFELDVELYVKRDDLTGCALSGNKVRKLEYLMFEALRRDCGAVVSCGGIQSNHCRATAVAAARLGLSCTVVLRGSPPEGSGLGNLLLDRLVGARVRWISAEDYRHRRNEIMEEEAEAWRSKGVEAMVIPEGGSNALGSCGYVECAGEIGQAQKTLGVTFDVVAHAVGSGGTVAGLAIGREVHELSYELIGYPVCDDNAYFQAIADGLFEDSAARFPQAKSARVTFEDQYKGIGYALSTPDEEVFLQKVARTEGLILDPAYTCKAFYGLIQDIQRKRWKAGSKILFIHTGGIFGTLGRQWTIEDGA